MLLIPDAKSTASLTKSLDDFWYSQLGSIQPPATVVLSIWQAFLKMNYKFSTRNFRMDFFLTKCHRLHVAVILRDPIIQLNMWLISSTTRNIMLASQTSKISRKGKSPLLSYQVPTVRNHPTLLLPHPTLHLHQLKASQSQGTILRFKKKALLNDSEGPKKKYNIIGCCKGCLMSTLMKTKFKEQDVLIGYRFSRTFINVSHHCHLDLHSKCYSRTGHVSSEVVGYDSKNRWHHHDLGHPNPNQVVPPIG